MNKLTTTSRPKKSTLLFTLIMMALTMGGGGLPSPATASTKPACTRMTFELSAYVVCSFKIPKSKLKLFHKDNNGKNFAQFSVLANAVKAKGRTLKFAMNAGMYHLNRNPVGLFIEDGQRKFPAQTGNAPGNFFMKPNGVFYVGRKKAGILETKTFLKNKISPLYATQSGPMLVIKGKLHPRFLPYSRSLHRRNGVGVSKNGRLTIFAISDAPVNFHTFARFFKDKLKTPNALYLDGTVSALYAPELGRNDIGLPMGPIIGVIE